MERSVVVISLLFRKQSRF